MKTWAPSSARSGVRRWWQRALQVLVLAIAEGASVASAASPASSQPTTADLAAAVIAATPPLEASRGNRLPIILWPLQGLESEPEEKLRRLLVDLDARGFSPVTRWRRAAPASRTAVLRLAELQQTLRLRVVINATDVLHPFFNGDPATAHRDREGKPFFGAQVVPSVQPGCPFALEERIPVIRDQVKEFVQAYRDRGVPLDLVLADWEVDGPMEWGTAQQESLRCVRCQEHVAHLERFADFQAAVRRVRARLQKLALADVVRESFPAALVGNYGVYPNDGYRYWYDYYEPEVVPLPGSSGGRAHARPWYQEFPETGYSLAMPVVYPWYRSFQWPDAPDRDFRWFQHLLVVGTNAARSTPASVPLLPFVHWRTTDPPAKPDPRVTQFPAAHYQELLWHLLLRGHDGFAVWSPRAELAEEARLVQEVYAASLPYREYLENGVPVSFAIPETAGPIVSGLRVGERLLVRRTDFDRRADAVVLSIEGRSLSVPRADAQCQILQLSGGGPRP